MSMPRNMALAWTTEKSSKRLAEAIAYRFKSPNINPKERNIWTTGMA
jgi:hypothetical protein